MWRLSGAEDLPYPNDDFARLDLHALLRDATDLSSSSGELALQAVEWPANYYLHPVRANLLRGFRWNPHATVLEVGAGCGSITRFLGETFPFVVAVEGEPSRAAVARERTRDLDNVEVVAAPLSGLEFNGGFDIVFCVGVLEYAPMFESGSDPFGTFLRRLRSAVAPGGIASSRHREPVRAQVLGGGRRGSHERRLRRLGGLPPVADPAPANVR